MSSTHLLQEALPSAASSSLPPFPLTGAHGSGRGVRTAPPSAAPDACRRPAGQQGRALGLHLLLTPCLTSEGTEAPRGWAPLPGHKARAVLALDLHSQPSPAQAPETAALPTESEARQVWTMPVPAPTPALLQSPGWELEGGRGPRREVCALTRAHVPPASQCQRPAPRGSHARPAQAQPARVHLPCDAPPPPRAQRAGSLQASPPAESSVHLPPPPPPFLAPWAKHATVGQDGPSRQPRALWRVPQERDRDMCDSQDTWSKRPGQAASWAQVVTALPVPLGPQTEAPPGLWAQSPPGGPSFSPLS